MRAKEAASDEMLSLLLPPAAAEALKNADEASACFGESFRDASVLFVEVRQRGGGGGKSGCVCVW